MHSPLPPRAGLRDGSGGGGGGGGGGGIDQYKDDSYRGGAEARGREVEAASTWEVSPAQVRALKNRVVALEQVCAFAPD